MDYYDDDTSSDAADLDDRELPDPSDADDPGDDDVGTVACPCCGEPVYEAAERCPHCGNYVSDVEAAGKRKRGWVVGTVVVCVVIAVIVWILRPS